MEFDEFFGKGGRCGKFAPGETGVNRVEKLVIKRNSDKMKKISERVLTN